MSEFNTPITELLGRSQDEFVGKRAIFAGELDPSILHLAKLCKEAVVLCDNYTAAQGMAALLGQELPPVLNAQAQYAHIRIVYTALQLFKAPECDLICLSLNKSKPVNQAVLAALTQGLEPDGLILAAGPNDAGGRSADGYLKSHGMLFKRDGARKCSLWQLNFDKNKPFDYPKHSLVLTESERTALTEALAASGLAAEDTVLEPAAAVQAMRNLLQSMQASEVLTACADEALHPDRTILKVASEGGRGSLNLIQDVSVFSPGRIDEGTAQLISCLKPHAKSPSLDLCCGCGIVGLELCARGIYTAFSDISASALFVTMLNLCVNRLTAKALTVSASNMLSDLSPAVLNEVGASYAQAIGTDAAAKFQGFGLIAVNPPFHQGSKKQTAPALGLFAAAKDFLSPNGALLCVGNTFLGYDRLMQDYLPHGRLEAATTRFVTTAGTLQPLQ